MYSRICSYNLYLPADCLPDVTEKAKRNIKIIKLSVKPIYNYNKEEKNPVEDVSAVCGGRSLTGFFLSGEG